MQPNGVVTKLITMIYYDFPPVIYDGFYSENESYSIMTGDPELVDSARLGPCHYHNLGWFLVCLA